MIKKDIIETEVRTSGFSEVQQQLMKSNELIDDHTRSIKNLEYEKRKLVSAGQRESKEYKNIEAEIRKVNAQLKTETANRKQLESQLNHNEMSYAQLTKRAAALTKELKHWKETDGQAKLDQTRTELTAVEEQIGKTKQALGLVSKDMQKSPSIWSKAWSSIKGLIPVASIGTALAFIKKGISEVIETSKKLQGDHVRNMASLGDEYGYVAMQAEKLHRRMGITKNDFITAAAATSDFMQSLDFDPTKAAKMSTELEYLAGVMNKWSGGKYTTEEASRYLQRALLGETRELKNLGFVINKNSDEFKARKKVLVEEQKVTEDQAQAMLVLQMAYEQTKDAQADFAAGGGGLLTVSNNVKSGLRGIKEELVELIALSGSERLEKKRQEVYAMNEEYQNQKRALEPLISAYEELYGRNDLTATEQERLNNAISRISRIAPGAIAQYDEYGKALALDVEWLEKFIWYQDEANKKQKEKVENQSIRQVKKDLRELRYASQEIKLLDDEIKEMQEHTFVTLNKGLGNVFEAEINNLMSAREALIAGNQKTTSEIQKRIDILVKEGYTYEEIGKNIGRNVKQVEELHRAYLKIEEDNKRRADAAAAEAAAAAALKLTDDEIKARAAALLAAKSAAEQEKAAFAERLKQNRLTEEEIAAIRAKSASERTEREQEDLAVYEALYQVHQNNLAEIDRKANASRLAEEEKAARERERLLQARDTIIGGGGTQTEQENYNYAKRLSDAGIYEDELKRISAKAAEDRTEEERKYFLAAEILRKQHEANLTKIETEAIGKQQSEREQAFARELTQLKTKHNDEYAAVGSYEEAIKLLQDKYADRDLSDIKTVGDARKAIREEQQRVEREATEAHYNQILQDLQALVSSGALDDLSIGDGILTEEQTKDIERRIDELKLKLSELGVGAVTEDSEKGGKKADSAGTDIFGMSQDDWETLFKNLEKSNLSLKEKVLIATTLASTLTDVFGKYGEYVSAQEAKQLRQYENNSKRRKRELENELAQGLISRKEYNSQIDQLEQELDDKRADIEIKQAKREKALAIVQTIINTAAAVAKASPNIALMALAALSGAAQIAIISAQTIPGKEKGGRIRVKREQDGRNFNAEFSPQKRGYVHGPTVIVGENGTEYVLSAADLKNPSVASFVESLERAKLQGGLRDFRMPYETGRSIRGKSAGGYVGSDSTDASSAAVSPAQPAYAGEMEDAVRESTEVSRKLLKRLEEPLYARLVWSGKDGVKAFMDKDASITRNVKI